MKYNLVLVLLLFLTGCGEEQQQKPESDSKSAVSDASKIAVAKPNRNQVQIESDTLRTAKVSSEVAPQIKSIDQRIAEYKSRLATMMVTDKAFEGKVEGEVHRYIEGKGLCMLQANYGSEETGTYELSAGFHNGNLIFLKETTYQTSLDPKSLNPRGEPSPVGTQTQKTYYLQNNAVLQGLQLETRHDPNQGKKQVSESLLEEVPPATELRTKVRQWEEFADGEGDYPAFL